MRTGQDLGSLKNSTTSGHVRIRTSPNLMMYFRDGRLVFENYMTRQSFHGSTDTILLLSHFSTWRTIDQVYYSLRQFSRASITDSVHDLLHYGLLIPEGSDEERLEAKFSKKWQWPTPSRYFHFATKLEEPFSTPQEIRAYYEKHLKGHAQPPIYKEYHGSRKVKLLSGAGPEAPLFETMRHRRTTREFSGKPIDLRDLSRIVYYTWGKLSTYNTKEFGKLLHKTSPSAGARHPIEAYAVINNVKGVAPGIYHYSVNHHSLELLRAGDFRDMCVKFAAGQGWTRNASALFLMTAAVSRTTWKYRIPRAYRAFLLDAGHLSQSFLMVSTALGLGAFCIGIINDVGIENELGIDGVNEAAVFAVGVGQPARRTRA
jgi:SagB-type dehydrogenase family enzyme